MRHYQNIHQNRVYYHLRINPVRSFLFIFLVTNQPGRTSNAGRKLSTALLHIF